MNSKRRDDVPVLFIDRNLGRHKVANALRSSRIPCEVHDDHLPQHATDEEWLSLVGRNGWIAIGRDKNIRYRSAEKEFRASDAKKTVTKFAQSYRDHLANYGQAATSQKLFFELITNRPIYSGLLTAVEGLASSSRLSGDALKQANQFEAAAGLTDDGLKEFASKFLLSR